MNGRIKIPADIAALFRDRENLRMIFKFVRALQRLSVKCDGNNAEIMVSAQNAIVDITDIVPRFKLPQQGEDTRRKLLRSNGFVGFEQWVDPNSV